MSNKRLIILMLILLAVISVEIGWYLILVKQRKTPSIIKRGNFDESRKLIYYSGSSRFLGGGLITASTSATLLIFPQPYGTPFYASPGEIELYPSPAYQVYHLPARERVVQYAVGFFVKWEQLPETKDRILVLADPKNKNIVYRFRVAFETSSLFGQNQTMLSIEDTDRINRGEREVFEKINKPIAMLDPYIIDRMIKKGDVVIVTPFFDVNEWTKKDDQGILLASWLILRRAGGKKALYDELGKNLD